MLVILEIEFVVVRELLATGDPPFGDDQNFLILVHVHHLSDTVWIAAVIHISAEKEKQQIETLDIRRNRYQRNT